MDRIDCSEISPQARKDCPNGHPADGAPCVSYRCERLIPAALVAEGATRASYRAAAKALAADKADR